MGKVCLPLVLKQTNTKITKIIFVDRWYKVNSIVDRKGTELKINLLFEIRELLD